MTTVLQVTCFCHFSHTTARLPVPSAYLASEADVVRGNVHLPEDVQLEGWTGEGALCVAIEHLVTRKAEHEPIRLHFTVGLQDLVQRIA